MLGERKKECPNCATEVPKESRVCYICGYEFPGKKSRLWILVALILLALFLIPFINFFIGL